MLSSSADAADEQAHDDVRHVAEFEALVEEFQTASERVQETSNRNASRPSSVSRVRLPQEPTRKRRSNKSNILTRALIVSIVLAIVTVIVISIVQAVDRSNAKQVRLAAEFATEMVAVAHAARTGKVECYVQFLDGPDNKHFPCNAIPLAPADDNLNNDYATIVTVLGMSSALAQRHSIQLYCAGMYGFTGSSDDAFSLAWPSRQGYVHTFVESSAGGEMATMNCQIRSVINLAVIRTIHVRMKLDARHRFIRKISH
jgi:hypothetical protein